MCWSTSSQSPQRSQSPSSGDTFTGTYGKEGYWECTAHLYGRQIMTDQTYVGSGHSTYFLCHTLKDLQKEGFAETEEDNVTVVQLHTSSPNPRNTHYSLAEESRHIKCSLHLCLRASVTVSDSFSRLEILESAT